jgi:hypothetical protein
MEDFLQHIDLEYYRSARLLIVRAEIAQLRRQSSASARAEKEREENPTGAPRRVKCRESVDQNQD